MNGISFKIADDMMTFQVISAVLVTWKEVCSHELVLELLQRTQSPMLKYDC